MYLLQSFWLFCLFIPFLRFSVNISLYMYVSVATLRLKLCLNCKNLNCYSSFQVVTVLLKINRKFMLFYTFLDISINISEAALSKLLHQLEHNKKTDWIVNVTFFILCYYIPTEALLWRWLDNTSIGSVHELPDEKTTVCRHFITLLLLFRCFKYLFVVIVTFE